MQGEFITPRELALLLGLFAAPVYLAAAGAVLLALSRRPRHVRPARRTVAVALAAATLFALPLTLFCWWASARLPRAVQAALLQGERPLGFGGYVSLPALAASVVCYGGAAVYLRRRARPPT